MLSSIEELQWRLPWRLLTHPLDLPGLQRQLERELAAEHPLWSGRPEVLARRVDNDDVLVRCSDGRFACVHLDWGRGPHPNPAEYPSTRVYGSLTDFQREMDADAADYDEE